jgi:protein-S-isoprenylcysteine O-methyltransferase Ste14
MKSWLFVFLQFGALGLIAITGPLLASNAWLLILELAGIALGVWAVLSMGIFNFNITPDVKRGSHLITSGPYELIRHPMYTALLVTTLPLIINYFTFVRLVIWVILLITLIFKSSYEESLLITSHKDYSEYMKATYRIIPFLY